MVTETQVIEALKTCYDPEVPVNIYDLGLVYGIEIEGGRVQIRMTLTSAHCPAARSIPAQVTDKVRAIPGVEEAQVELVWDPPWDRTRITPAGRERLGIRI